MATCIAVVGFSSTGKSTSLVTLDPKETFIISPSKGEIPIPGFKANYTTFNETTNEGNFYRTNNLNVLAGLLQHISNNRPDIKCIVVEDMTHYFNAVTLSENFRAAGKSKDGSWSRWADFGSYVFSSIFEKLPTMRDDLFLITQYHAEVYTEGIVEKVKIKTPGNLLEREVDIPSYYNYVFYTKVLPFSKELKSNERYRFVTNNDGYCPAKTPYGLFEELEIPNDMKLVLDRIKSF